MAARKTALLVAALLIVPTMLAPRAPQHVGRGRDRRASPPPRISGGRRTSSRSVSDMFPRSAVASVVGIGGFAGAMGGVLFQRATGRVLQATDNNYGLIFVVCGLAYVVAWTIVHLLVPRLEPARLSSASRST